MTQLHQALKLIKIKDLIGAIGVVVVMTAFSYFYFSCKAGISSEEEKYFLEGVYWLGSSFSFLCLSFTLYCDHRKELIGVLYLLLCFFSGICFFASFLDYLYLDELRMSKVYWAIIGTFILTTATYLIKWIRYSFS